MNIAKSFLGFTERYCATYEDIFDYDNKFDFVLYIQPKIAQEPGNNENLQELGNNEIAQEPGNNENMEVITIELKNPYLYLVSNFVEMLDAIKSDKEYSLLGWDQDELYYNECKIKYYEKGKEYLIQTGKEECIECVTQIIDAFKTANKWRYKIDFPYVYIANNNSQVCLKIGRNFKIGEFNKILTILTSSNDYGYRKKFGRVTIECFYSIERPGLYIQIKQGKNMVNVSISPNDAYLLVTDIIRDLQVFA